MVPVKYEAPDFSNAPLSSSGPPPSFRLPPVVSLESPQFHDQEHMMHMATVKRILPIGVQVKATSLVARICRGFLHSNPEAREAGPEPMRPF